MTATVYKLNPILQGDELIDYVHANCARISNSQLAEECGYPSQESFREALTAARLFRGEYTDSNGIPNFDVALLEHLEETLCVTQTECVDIARQLRDDYGIDDYHDYQDVFAYQSDCYHWESEFAEYWATEVCCFNQSDDFSWIVIDWQATWDCNLRYDFSVIEYSDGVILLHNN